MIRPAGGSAPGALHIERQRSRQGDLTGVLLHLASAAHTAAAVARWQYPVTVHPALLGLMTPHYAFKFDEQQCAASSWSLRPYMLLQGRWAPSLAWRRR